MCFNDRTAQRLYENGVQIVGAVTVQRRAAELFRAWRGFEELPRFIDQLRSVDSVGAGRTRWTVEAGGQRHTWEAEVIHEEPDRRIAWRTVPESEVVHAGTVMFHELPYHRGTEVKAVIEYVPASGLGRLGAIFGPEPATVLRRGLHRFRQVMETGEIATSCGQPAGANASRSDRAGEAERSTDADLRDISGGPGSSTGGRR